MEFRDAITVQTLGGARLQLMRRAVLAGSSPRGSAWPAQRAEPIRYELLSGEVVQELGPNLWRHPLTGEELRFVGLGVVNDG